MQTVFEVFDPVTGSTEGYKDAAGAKRYIARMEKAGYVRDFLPTEYEGFYVVDMRGSVISNCKPSRDAAQSFADFSNMGSDTNSYSVIEHRL